jgi:hypothetical protein
MGVFCFFVYASSLCECCFVLAAGAVLLVRQSSVFFSLMKRTKNQGCVSFPLLVQYEGKGQAGAAQGKQECRAYQNSLWWLSLCAVWGGLRVVSVVSQRGFQLKH